MGRIRMLKGGLVVSSSQHSSADCTPSAFALFAYLFYVKRNQKRSVTRLGRLIARSCWRIAGRFFASRERGHRQRAAPVHWRLRMAGSSAQSTNEHGCASPFPDQICTQCDSLLRHLWRTVQQRGGADPLRFLRDGIISAVDEMCDSCASSIQPWASSNREESGIRHLYKVLQLKYSGDAIEFVTFGTENVAHEDDDTEEDTLDEVEDHESDEVEEYDLDDCPIPTSSPLFAVIHDDVAKVESMLDAGDLGLDEEIPLPAAWHAQGTSLTLLQAAAFFDAKDVITLLIERKASLDLQNVEGQTALLLAVQRGNSSVACCLLEAGADASIRNVRNASAMCYAEESGDLKMMAMLCKCRSPGSALPRLPHTLGDACAIDDAETFAAWLDLGVPIDTVYSPACSMTSTTRCRSPCCTSPRSWAPKR